MLYDIKYCYTILNIVIIQAMDQHCVYEPEKIPMIARSLAGAPEKTLVTLSTGAHGAENNHRWAGLQTVNSSGSGRHFQGEGRTATRFRGAHGTTTDSRAGSGTVRKKDATRTGSWTFLRGIASDTDMAARMNCEAAAVGDLVQLPESPADFSDALEAALSIC